MLGEGFRDIQTYTSVEQALEPASSSSARNGNIITVDTMGLDLVIYAGDLPADLVAGSAFYGFTVKESDASDMAGETNVDASLLIVDGVPGGSLPVVNVETQEKAVVARIQYRGYKPYIRLATTKTGSPSAGILGAIALKGGKRNNP